MEQGFYVDLPPEESKAGQIIESSGNSCNNLSVISKDNSSLLLLIIFVLIVVIFILLFFVYSLKNENNGLRNINNQLITKLKVFLMFFICK